MTVAPKPKIERVPISSLTTHPQNPRTGDIETIAESLQTHGQFRPIVVQRSTRHILAGNHTMLAATKLGWDKIDVVFLDVDDDQARRILIVDNRAAALGTDDPDLLLGLLNDFIDTDLGLAGTGFDADALDDLLRMTTMPPDLPPADGEQVSFVAGKPQDEVVCPACGHTWTV